MGDTIAEIMKHPAFAPSAMVLGAGFWMGAKIGLSKLKLDATKEMINTLVALMLLGAYIYMWTQGNPHDGELKELGDMYIDLPLMLLGGYYLSNLYPFKGLQAVYSILSVAWIGSSIYEQKGLNVGDVFFFAMEAPVIMDLGLKIMECFETHECLTLIFKAVAAAVYAGTRLLAAGYTIIKLVEKEDAPMEIRILGALTYVLSLLFITNFVDMIKGCGEPSNQVVRSRSSSRSRSRSRSCGRAKQRSRSRTPKRKKC